jgi:hypothetical protein
VSDRHFSPEEVERLIPALTAIMDRVRAAHAEAATMREGLREEQGRITMSGGGVLDQRAWRERAERLTRSTRALEAGLAEITTMGGVPKDLDLGLVDFAHLREGRVVNLCWKYGEKEIRYWHGMQEGYGGRKPL